MNQAIIDTNDKPKRYQCRHIFTDGRRCGSACLRHEEFCYYHHTTRTPAANPRARRGRRSTFEIPLPEDRSAIQASIGQVLRRIASNDIDPRRAGLLLYGLQIASLNLPKPAHSGRNRNAAETAEVVEEISTHPELGTLAPKAEVNQHGRRPGSLISLLLEDLEQKSARTHPGTPAQNTPEPTSLSPQEPMQTATEEPALTEPAILPELNAEAETRARRHRTKPGPRRASHKKSEAGAHVKGLLPQLLHCSNGELETELPLGHSGDTDQTSTQKQEGCRLRNRRRWRKPGNSPGTSILNRDKPWRDCRRICLHDQEVAIVSRRNVRCSKEVEVDHAAIRRAGDHVRRLRA